MAAARRSPYDRVRVESALWRAWAKVRANGQRSTSRQTRIEVAEFEKIASKAIPSLSRRLRRRTFRFEPAMGYTKKRPGKAARPIVVATIETRIVQRSLLNVLKDFPATMPYFEMPTSFGMRGVEEAIEVAYDLVTQGGAAFYIRSDIADFFARIPRTTPLATVAQLIDDNGFNDLLRSAMDVDLKNAESLGESIFLFPGVEDGVAQGCALSAFLGDVLLREFDLAMNGRGIACLRYVDDFALLGPGPSSVRKAFAHGQDWLGKVGLHAYLPGVDGKADEGWTRKKWEFLGCEIVPGIIRPSSRSKRKLLERVESVLSASGRVVRDPLSVRGRGASLAETLRGVDHLVQGWGNHYKFCNDAAGFRAVDEMIDTLLDRFLAICGVRIDPPTGPDSVANRRRILGVHLLTDSKSDPIVERKHRGAG